MKNDDEKNYAYRNDAKQQFIFLRQALSLSLSPFYF